MAAVVRDPASRVISPTLLVLAGLCFLLPFASVSCNTATAGTELGSLSSISEHLGGGAIPSSETQALTDCLNSLNSYAVATYSGLDLASGSAPTQGSGTPAGCAALAQVESPIPTAAAAGQGGTGVQPLLLLALAGMLLGLLLSFAHFALRGLAVAATAMAAVILLLVEQGQVSSQILDRISGAALGSLSGLLPSGVGGLGGEVSNYLSTPLSSYLRVSTGIGLILAVVALGVVVLYNPAVQLVPLPLRTPPGSPVDCTDRPSPAPATPPGA
jgi:hypothetical protein